MDKKLKRSIESQLVIGIEGILSRIHPSASLSSKKKIKEAGKMIAKKFAKEVASSKLTNGKVSNQKSETKSKSTGILPKPKRDSHGRFSKRKK